MFKKYLCSFLLLCIAGSQYAGAYSGSGTPESPYLITSVSDLEQLGSDVDNYDKCFLQVNDIVFSEEYYIDAIIAGGETGFSGTYDGGGFSIQNMAISNTEESYLGLFGTVDAVAVIKNVNLIDCSVYGYSRVGGIAGICYGKIYDCSADVFISALSRAGGIVGEANNTEINRCKVSGVISATDYVGGIIGLGDAADVTNSYTLCDILDASQYSYGGIIGRANGGNVLNCYCAGIDDDLENLNIFGMGQGVTKINCHTGDEDLTQRSIFENWDFSDSIEDGLDSVWLITEGQMPKLHFEGLLNVDTSLISYSVFTTDSVLSIDHNLALSLAMGGSEASGSVLPSADSWLTVDPTTFELSGQSPVNIGLNMDMSGLLPGDYSSTVSVICDDDNFEYVIPVSVSVIQPIGMETFATLAEHWMAVDCYGGFACSECDYSENGTIDISDLAMLVDSWLQAEVKTEFYDDFEYDQINSHYWSSVSPYYPIFSLITDASGNKLLETNSYINTLVLNVDLTGKSKVSFDLQVYAADATSTLQLNAKGNPVKLWTVTEGMHTETLDIPEGESGSVGIMFMYSKGFMSSSYVRIDNVRVY